MRFIQRSVHQILRSAAHGGTDDELSDYDIVYCAGLFDYLSQRVCQRLVELFCRLARPGGLVIVTNVAASNPRKACMEYLMEWNLIHRSIEEMNDLIPSGLPVKRAEVKADATGVNLFLEIELADA
jgi:extracellular factor (EF) 3-hydroxypalmitic acid methyl ester biosynthesis protein